MDIWDFVLWIHLLAMAMFVGGQFFLGLAVVPVYLKQGGAGSPAVEWLVPVARRYGYASLVALAIAFVTGTIMASHLDIWSETEMSIKMGLVLVAIALVSLHVFIAHGSNKLLQGLILLDSLAIVFVATLI